MLPLSFGPVLFFQIYHDQTLLDLAMPPLWSALVLFLGGVIGARAQAVAGSRTWGAQYPAWHAQGLSPPVIIDQVRTPAASLPAAADRPPADPREPVPARLLAPPPRPPVAGPAPGSPATAPAPTGSWPAPFFR